MSIISAASTARLNITPTVVTPDRFDSVTGNKVDLINQFRVENTTSNISGFARTLTGKSSGKYYFEISWENATVGTGTVGCGLVKSTVSVEAEPSGSADFWGVWGRNQGARHNGSNTISFASDASERWGFAVDLDAGELWIWDGNADAWLQGDPETGTSPIWSNLSGYTLHPMAEPWTPSVNLTLHSSYKSLARAVPDGFIAGWPAGDPYFDSVVLLLPFDGTDGDTTTTDYSNSAHTITFSGNAEIDTAVSKFGGASYVGDGNGDYVSAPDSTDWDFGTGDFTIELWFNASGIVGTEIYCFVSQYTSSVSGISFQWRNDSGYTGGSLVAGWGDTVLSRYDSWTPTDDTWYHIAWARSGTSLKLFLDGAEVDSDTNSTNMTGSTAPMHVGCLRAANPTFSHLGNIDDVRITKGVARYTGAFTPPTKAHPLG